jgi:hypothetical protein
VNDQGVPVYLADPVLTVSTTKCRARTTQSRSSPRRRRR